MTIYLDTETTGLNHIMRNPDSAEKLCYAHYEEGPYYRGKNDDPDYAYMADVHELTHADLVTVNIDSIVEQIQENGFEEVGEVADNYLYLNPQQTDALEAHLKTAIIEWLNTNVAQPKFFRADNIRPLEKKS